MIILACIKREFGKFVFGLGALHSLWVRKFVLFGLIAKTLHIGQHFVYFVGLAMPCFFQKKSNALGGECSIKMRQNKAEQFYTEYSECFATKG